MATTLYRFDGPIQLSSAAFRVLTLLALRSYSACMPIQNQDDLLTLERSRHAVS
jgi:hypothetical protein